MGGNQTHNPVPNGRTVPTTAGHTVLPGLLLISDLQDLHNEFFFFFNQCSGGCETVLFPLFVNHEGLLI